MYAGRDEAREAFAPSERWAFSKRYLASEDPQDLPHFSGNTVVNAAGARPPTTPRPTWWQTGRSATVPLGRGIGHAGVPHGPSRAKVSAIRPIGGAP